MKKKIIIVDDDRDILDALAIMLSDSYDVLALESADRIVKRDVEPPDLFILDKRMPYMDGLDLCRLIRKDPRLKKIPVVIVSASPKFGQLAREAGATDFLDKPFDMKALIGIVDKLLG
jgi:DNA-binding response OmpR family regulator